ncbi:MAG: hypothetical protein QXM43_04455 [Desulfurococcaceae archaeon]
MMWGCYSVGIACVRDTPMASPSELRNRELNTGSLASAIPATLNAHNALLNTTWTPYMQSRITLLLRGSRVISSSNVRHMFLHIHVLHMGLVMAR